MTGNAAVLLPYRADAAELVSWVEARARGRTPAQLREELASAKAREGVTLAASLLGFARDGELTERGRELALADAEARRALLRDALLGFAPYGELLAELRARGLARVEAGWIEAWWATHGYGGSQSNRQEGIAVLGRLAEHAGLARYVQGRRGYPTRIEWDLRALARLDAPPAEASAPEPEPEPERAAAEPAAAEGPVRPAQVQVAPVEVNRVRISLEGGLTAELEVPTRLSRGEKRRLLDLLDLLVADE
jgi:hypothetical protein